MQVDEVVDEEEGRPLPANYVLPDFTPGVMQDINSRKPRILKSTRREIL
jgi:hypothetical protein